MAEMNKKVWVKTSRLIELKGYYVCMYRAKMVELYDAGYVSDPTRFNEVEIRTCILDMGIKGFTSSSGNIVLDTEHIEYAIYKNKDNNKIQDFLNTLYDALKYREYCADINHFYDYNNFFENNRNTVSMGIKNYASKLDSKSSYGISRAIVSCFLNKGMTVMEMSFADKLWDMAMEKLGIPESEWHDDGLIDKDLTHAEEVRCINLLLEGKVFPTGKYKYTFQDWLYNHKWKTKGMTTSCKGLYNYLFSSCSEEIFAMEGDILNNLHKRGIKVYAMCGCKYYIAKPIKRYNVPIGCFVVVGGEDKLLFDGAVLSGYTGEVYSEDYLIEEEIAYVGCPFEIYVNPKEKSLFYDIEQVDIKSKTWFEMEDVSIDFYDSMEDIPTVPQLEISDSKIKELYTIYKESLMGKFIGVMHNIKGLEIAKKMIMKYI